MARWWRRFVHPTESRSIQRNAVAQRAQAREDLGPAVLARHAEDAEVATAAEPYPLRHHHVGAGLDLLGLGDDLVTLLSADAQRLGPHQPDLLDAGRFRQETAREAVAVAGFRRGAGSRRNQDKRLLRNILRLACAIRQQRRGAAEHLGDAKPREVADG